MVSVDDVVVSVGSEGTVVVVSWLGEVSTEAGTAVGGIDNKTVIIAWYRRHCSRTTASGGKRTSRRRRSALLKGAFLFSSFLLQKGKSISYVQQMMAISDLESAYILAQILIRHKRKIAEALKISREKITASSCLKSRKMLLFFVGNP